MFVGDKVRYMAFIIMSRNLRLKFGKDILVDRHIHTEKKWWTWWRDEGILGVYRKS